jgi:hypothetical protein
MRVVRTRINAQICHLLARQWTTGQHTFDGLHHDTFGMRAF